MSCNKGAEMQYFFPQLSFFPILVGVVVIALFCLNAYFFVFKTSLFDHLEQKPLIPPFISVPTTILSLIVGFMASSVWENTTLAVSSLQDEKLALQRLYLLPLQPISLKPELLTEVGKYESLVRQKEWGMRYNIEKIDEVDAVLEEIYSIAWAADRAKCSEQGLIYKCNSDEIVGELIRVINQLNAAREQRIMLGSLSNFDYFGKWLFIYLLAQISAINIAAEHRSNPKGAVIALAVFCACTALVFSMISVYIHPYKGFNALRPTLL